MSLSGPETIYGNFIDGEWIAGGELAEDINPSDTRDIVGRSVRATRVDADKAVASARHAFAKWCHSGLQQRHDFLKGIGDEILARKDEIGRLLSREEGKTLAEGIGETARAGQVFLFFAQEVLRLAGEKLGSVRQGIDIEITREPVGVVGIITPWNFPIALPSWKIAAALAYGNTVVWKPADLVPATANALATIIERAGCPRGVFNLVNGRGSVVGEAILANPDVAAVTFTGSVQTGARVAGACAASFKKMQLEMGGKNPLVVLDDADLAVAVECAANGAFFSTGQRCTASSRLIVTDAIHDQFVAALIERMRSLVVGDALDPASHIGPVVDDNQLRQNLSYIDIGRADGARLAAGGEAFDAGRPGYYMRPALFTEADNSMRIAREEIFGPVACVIRARNYEEALAMANDTIFGLSAGVCTTSLKYASHFKRNAEAGIVTVNLPTAGIDFHVPFGGRKGSSYGPREQGRYAAEFYTTVKTAYVLAG
ncbi:aldehyde dehydrogenase (NAD+) [Aminobacter lissarensis]|uniref:Aldehyde dehydrogenase (NAD+) n=1 Tax=Aminobacter carboxidus TaxID=376165 RepID=A0A8E1WJ92_9HYPH|nr:aldehyde dehydrogenase family protein [Aminobacter lissarensis]MBB6470055.1 aldehyde dehydrogenase (NAD+) [Aminobacter lissarensis]